MPDVVLAMLTDAEAAKAKVAEAQKVVRNRQTATVDELKRHLD